MCGIAGIVASNGGNKVAEGEILALTQHLRHRGPDAQGIWMSQDCRVALGHARLSILDLSQEAGQPMKNADGRLVIVFNGEIYNFLELAGTLRKRGYAFRTQSDTEVLLHGWDCWGMEMFDQLNGMWALAIHDTFSGETLLCRDRYGVKPLYYEALQSRFVFSSEIQAIDKLNAGRLAIDPRYFQSLGRLEAGEETYLSGVRCLLPGHCLRLGRDGRVETRRWYTLSQTEVPTKFRDQAELLKEMATDACRLRLRSDVPVATCLSGGVDSGSLVALLSRLPGKDPRFPGFDHRSFTAAFPGSHLDETEAARALASHCGIEFDVKTVTCPSPDELENALGACDGPMPTLAFYPIWKLYQHIRQKGIVVTLDGIGPDETMGGYYIGREALQSALHERNPFRLVDLYRTYGALYRDSREWIRGDLKIAARQEGSRWKRTLGKMMSSPCASQQGTGGLASLVPSLPPWVPARHPMEGDPLARTLWNQFFTAPLPFFLLQYDRCSMANGVECRMPFMDYRLVEYVFSLPLASRVGNGYTKRVLREALRGILPDGIRLNRLKTGFNAPFSEWLQGPLKEWMLDISGSSGFIDNPYFEGRSLSARIRSHERLDERQVWPALHLAWWMMRRKGDANDTLAI